MLDGLMNMLGNQWASRLTRLDKDGTPHEKTLALERRRGKAESLLFSQSGYLIGFLVLSIIFFLAGFMLQVFSIARFGFEKQSRILIVAGVLALGMCGVAAAAIGWTTWHAIKDPDSPFRSRFSTGIQDVMQWISGRWTGKKTVEDTASEGKNGEGKDLFEVKNGDIERAWEWYDNGERSITTETLKVYARLVKNATETEVLDRAVPSFSFIPWYFADNAPFPVFETIYARFAETDTSFRVKETLVQQFVAFRAWLYKERKKEDKKVVQWCREECDRLYYQSTDSESKAKWFPLWVFFTSFERENDDLRWSGTLPFEDCVLRVLRSYDQNRKLGERSGIFYCALLECESLVQGKIVIDDVTRLSILRSLIRNPNWDWGYIEDLVLLITQGKETQILTELSDFIANPPVLHRPQGLLDFLTDLAFSLPDDFTIPSNLDLSSLLSTFAHDGPDSDNWRKHSNALIFYFDHGAFNQLSHISPAVRFLNQCCNGSLGSYWKDKERTSTATHDRAAFYLKEYETRYLPLSSLPDSDCDMLCDALRIYDPDRGPIPYLEPRREFMGTVNHCSFLLLTDKLDGFPDLISSHHVSILTSLLNSSLLDWLTIEPFVSHIAKNNTSILYDVLACVDLFQQEPYQSSINPLIIHFLVHLKKMNAPIPQSYDLSPVLVVIAHQEPDLFTWQRYSDTLMYYLDNGAFEHLSDPEPTRKFFQLCANVPSSDSYDYRDKTSDETRERAEYYLQQLDGDFSNFSASNLVQGPSTSNAGAPHPIPRPSASRSLAKNIARFGTESNIGRRIRRALGVKGGDGEDEEISLSGV